MKVMLTATTGFIGSHLKDLLTQHGHDVICAEDVLKNASIAYSDLDEISEYLKGVEVLWHLSGSPNEALSVFSPCTITYSTYMSSVFIATAAIKAGVKRLVYVSSVARYGKQDRVPFTEDMIPNPQDPYGIAKVAAENTLLCLGRAHGMEIVVAVPHNVIGPGMRYDNPYANVVGIMTNRMMQGLNPIIFGDGSQRRCFTYIDDCTEALMRLGFASDLDGQVINIGPVHDESVSINFLARIIAARLGFTLGIINVGDRPLEVKDVWCNGAKCQNLTGYAPVIGLELALISTLNWMKTQGPKPFEYRGKVELAESPLLPRLWKEQLL